MLAPLIVPCVADFVMEKSVAGRTLLEMSLADQFDALIHVLYRFVGTFMMQSDGILPNAFAFKSVGTDVQEVKS